VILLLSNTSSSDPLLSGIQQPTLSARACGRLNCGPLKSAPQKYRIVRDGQIALSRYQFLLKMFILFPR
jgi:hypothetical protein